MTRYRPLPPKPYYARSLTLTERWLKLFPGSSPPRPEFKLPFLSQEKTNKVYLLVCVGYYQTRNWMTSPYFKAGVFFGFAGYYATLLPFYKDQFVRYGSPGLHPIQKQNLTTFQFVTAPMAVNHARSLGMKIAESVESESPIIQFLETPFLKRLDLYPQAALFEMSPQWATLLGENYTALLDYHKKGTKKSLERRDLIPCTQNLSTTHPIDYQPSHILHRLDPWARQRFFFDFADEVPTRLEDAFGLDSGLSRQNPTQPDLQAVAWHSPDQKSSHVKSSFGPFTVKPINILALQTGWNSNPSNWIYGIPFGSRLERPEIKLPPYMLDVDETLFLPKDSDDDSLESMVKTRDAESEVGVLQVLEPEVAADKAKAAQGATEDDQAVTEPDDVDLVPPGLKVLTKPSTDFQEKSLVEVDDMLSNWRHRESLNSYPFDFPLFPRQEAAPSFDLFSLTEAEADMSPPPPLPARPVLVAPRGYRTLIKYLLTFNKKEQKGLYALTAVDKVDGIVEFDISLEQEELKKKKEAVATGQKYKRSALSKIVERFSTKMAYRLASVDSYLRRLCFTDVQPLLDYRTKKLKIQAADREYAPVRERAQDLRNYLYESLPHAFLEYLQKTALLMESSNSVDWFGHRPMSREDWEVFISKTLSMSRKKPFRYIRLVDLTVDDVRAVIKDFFGGVDLANLSPSELQSGFLSRAFYQTLDKNTRPDDLWEDSSNYFLVHFHTLLKQYGLSNGPDFIIPHPDNSFARYVIKNRRLPHPDRSFISYVLKFKSIPPADQISGGEMKANVLVRGRYFYEPITDWLDSKKKGSRLELPHGSEFLWAVEAQERLSRDGMETPEGFAHMLGSELAKFSPRYGKMLGVKGYGKTRGSKGKGIALEDQLARFQLGEQLRLTIHQTLQTYLSRVSTAPFMGLIDVQVPPLKKAFGREYNYPFNNFLDLAVTNVHPRKEVCLSVDDYIYRLKMANLTRRASRSFMTFMNHQPVFGSMRQYRQDWWRPFPRMDGFLFPDTFSDALTLGRQLQLDAARYRISSRSLWESFAAMTSLRPLEVALPPGYRLFMSRSLPDFSRPRSVDLAYSSVNIFPNYDFPSAPSELPPYTFLQEFYPDLDVSFLPEIPKPDLDTKSKFESEVRKKSDKNKNEEDVSENYFEYPFTLARQNGDLDISPTILRWVYDYYLGPQNWIKDRPTDFLGLQALTFGNKAHRFTRLMRREQMMNFFTPVQKNYVFGPVDTSHLPSQLEAGRIMYSTFLNEEGQNMTSRLLFGKRARRLYFLLVHKKKAAVRSRRFLALPELSMDEWHDLFKTSLDRARRYETPFLNLDLPPIQPVTLSRPEYFVGDIYVDPLATAPKQRSQALAQILLLASRAKPGAYNIPDYVNLRTVHTTHSVSTPGMRRDLLPIFWHSSSLLEKNKMITHNAGRPLRLPSKNRDVAIPQLPYTPKHTNIQRKWWNAETFLQTKTSLRHKILRLAQMKNFPYLADFDLDQSLIPGTQTMKRDQLKEPLPRLEPVTFYSLFMGTQLFLLPITAFLTKFFVTLSMRYFLIDYLYSLYRRFWENRLTARLIRKSIVYCIEFLKPRKPPFRVFKNIKRRFTDLVGTEPAVLTGAAKIAVSLRNRGRGGPQSAKGVILYGPPGNGKTFLVQAIAGEAHVPVVALTSSELVDNRRYNYPTDGLVLAFKLARKMAPCILFIDEIDGIGRKRSSLIELQNRTPHPVEDGLLSFIRTVPPRVTFPFVVRGQLDEAYVNSLITNPFLAKKKLREKSMEGLIDLNRFNIDNDAPDGPLLEVGKAYEEPESELSPSEIQFGRKVSSKSKLLTDPTRVALLTVFLQLMDSLRPYHGVMVIGATNRLESVDPAIRRQGRLDRRIGIPAPADERRIEIMRFYADRLKLQETIPWDYMADRTRAYSVADLETMVNQSALIAIRKNEQHSLSSFEDAIEGVTRHRHIRENLTPFPIVKKLPSHDPLFFVRSAYYQASRALIYNILPDHPTLPFAQLQLEHFVPDVPIHELMQRAYTLPDLEDRLTAMLAGKAGESLLLYGSPLRDQVEINERQTWESSIGGDELSYALELAYAIVDQWLVIDDFMLPLRKALDLEEGANDENFFEPGGDIGRPHFLRYKLQKDTKRIRRVRRLHSSMLDKKYRIHNNFADTLRWFGGAKASLNTSLPVFRQLILHFEKDTFVRTIERLEIWNAANQYYVTHPYFKFMNDSSGGSLNAPNPNEAKMNEVLVRPTYPDLVELDRDYLMQTLMLKCFNNALELLEKHRTVVEQMAIHLLNNKKLRSFEMYAYIRAYTAELRELKPETKVRTEPVKGQMPALDTYGRQPESRLRTINGRQVLLIDQSWGPESNKPGTQSIPTSIFIDGPESSVWSSQIILDKSTGESDTGPAVVSDVGQRTHVDYIARSAKASKLYYDLYHQRVLDRLAKQDIQDRFVYDLLCSMAPALRDYLLHMDEEEI